MTQRLQILDDYSPAKNVMQYVLTLSVVAYFLSYAFEAPLRYGLHLLGVDYLIYLRDFLIDFPLILIFTSQVIKHKLSPAYIIFIFVVLFHGTIMVLNTGSILGALGGSKNLIGMLAGAIVPPRLFRPTRNGLIFFGFLWVATLVGVVIDKYFFDFPWVGVQYSIGDYNVDISQDWQIEGDDKRAGGFMRSSISIAIFEPLLALLLMYNVRDRLFQIIVAALTGFALFCATQKGAMVAFAIVMGLIAISPRKPMISLKWGLGFVLAMAIALPLILPNYTMPSAAGVFSFASFYDRIEYMWPQGWDWIRHHEIFPFGVGLGGISGAQRFYANDEMTYADNMFVFLYAYFGVMSFVYLGWILAKVMQLRTLCSQTALQAVATLVFLFGYGNVISLFEDELSMIFLGAAIAWIAYEVEQQSKPVNEALILSSEMST